MNRLLLKKGQQINNWTVLRCEENKWRIRCICGQQFVRKAAEIRRSLECKSCAHRGVKSSSWKGGRHYSSGGYILLTNPDNYLGKTRKISGNTCVALEHIVIMSRHLGRALFDNETVHHKNGVRDDNRIKNLELWVKPQPTGIRVEDAIKWAQEIICRYGE